MSSAPLHTRRLDAARDADVAEAVRLLRAGRLVAVPTETVYGLAADATDPEAVRGIFAAKGRPSNHPLIVHVGDPAWLDAWARDVPETARRLAAAFWPGPLTLLLHKAAAVPAEVTGGRDTIGLRMPDHPVLLRVLRALGHGVAAALAQQGQLVAGLVVLLKHRFEIAGPAVEEILPFVLGLGSGGLDLGLVGGQLILQADAETVLVVHGGLLDGCYVHDL